MTIYRAISEDEKNNLIDTGIFIPKAGGFETKLFTDSLESASTFGRSFFPFDQKPFYIVEVTVDNTFSEKLFYEMIDEGLDVGVTIAVDRDILHEFNNKMTFTILDHGTI